MDKKIRFLLLLLGIASFVLAGTTAWIYISSRAEVADSTKKQAQLEKQSTYLQEKLDDTQKEARYSREKLEAIKADLNKLGREYTLLQSQYAALLEEKESLAKEKQDTSSQLERLNKLYFQEQEKARLGASDKFLASLLEEKASLQVEIEKLKGKISSQEEYLEDVEKRSKPSQEKLDQLSKEKELLEKKAEDLQRASGILSSDLLKERKERISLVEDLARAEEQLKTMSAERDGLTEQLVKMKQALEQRLIELSETKQVLEGAVEGAEKVVSKTKPASIELPPIVVRAEQKALSLPSKLPKTHALKEKTLEMEARVITVNDRHKFVVIDIGRDNGVEQGMTFDVYRRDEKIGKIEVIETRKTISACDVKETGVTRLKVNDIVKR